MLLIIFNKILYKNISSSYVPGITSMSKMFRVL